MPRRTFHSFEIFLMILVRHFADFSSRWEYAKVNSLFINFLYFICWIISGYCPFEGLRDYLYCRSQHGGGTEVISLTRWPSRYHVILIWLGLYLPLIAIPKWLSRILEGWALTCDMAQYMLSDKHGDFENICWCRRIKFYGRLKEGNVSGARKLDNYKSTNLISRCQLYFFNFPLSGSRKKPAIQIFLFYFLILP